MNIYSFSAVQNNKAEVTLETFKGKVILIVNTASKCGFTPQYKGLQQLYEKYQKKGLVILGFPCNQFGKQEQGDDASIQEFCQVNYGVTFPIFLKTDVNGPMAHPLFDYLKTNARGVLGSKAIKWNFTKFLVNKEGEVIKRYSPATTPEKMTSNIESLLQE